MGKKLINFSQFAKIVGVSSQRICVAAKAGKVSYKIVDKKKLVDAVAAKKEWEANMSSYRRNPSGLNKKASKKKAVSKKVSKKQITKIVEKPKEVPRFEGMTTADADRKKKVFDAKLSELKFLEQAKELLKVSDVKAEAFDIARTIRDGILSLPARIAHEIAAETDPRKAEIFLLKELTKLLTKLIKENKRK